MQSTVGQQLKIARTQRGLTIEQAARDLHIRQKYLEALEEDHRKELPSLVQGKGFLRMYADYLSLPQQVLLDAWDGKVVTVSVEPIQEIDTNPQDAPPEPEPTAQSITLESAASVSASASFVPASTSDDPVQPIPLPTDSTITPTASAKSAFIEIGRQLARQRMALGLSLPEVERYTHVRAHYLDALEEGQIDRLPSPVQGRGMLSNYARFLNLNVDALLLQFAEGLQIHRVERLVPPDTKTKPPASTRKAAPQKTGTRRLFSRDLWVSSLLVMIILGFALWTMAQVDALNQPDDTSPPPPSIADVLLNKATNTPSPTGTSTPQALLSTLAPGEVQSGQPQAGLPATTLTLPVSGNAPLQVYVIARIRAFLRITVDGKVVFEGRVVPGNAYPFSGEKKIELLTGSAAAIQVFFNQKDLGSLGLNGQAKSMVFTKDGALTPTSAYTVTPTRTVQPTSTLKPSATLPTSTITPLVP